MNHLDLFSGIGGFALAAKWAGFETIGFCENDSFCKKILNKHWPDVYIFPDIETMHHWGHVDLLTGGFPCQPFSIAGKKRGINDDRYLWSEFYRIIRECHPHWIIAENVSAIVGMELDNILSDLERAGYEAQSFIIPACAANAPHRRDRLWIVANAMQQRCDNGIYYWQSRYIQKDKKWDVEALQQEWEKLKPKSWATRTVSNWMAFNTESLRGNYGIPSKLDSSRVKALGNAIVPQIVYPLMKFIYELETKGS